MLLVTMICVLALIRSAGVFFGGEIRSGNTTLLLPLFGLLLFAIFQTIVLHGSENPISVEPYATLRFACFLAGLILAFDILLAASRTYFRLGFLVAVVIAIAVVSSVFGLVYKWSPIFAAEMSSAFASTEPSYAQFANRNHFAFLMEMAIGLLTALLLYGGFSFRNFGLVAYVVVVVSLIDVQSRGGLVSWIFISAVAVFFYILTRTQNETRTLGRRPNPQWLRKIVLATGICSLILAAMVVLIAAVGGDALVTRFETIEQEVVAPNDLTRINRGEIWSSTVELIKQHPIAGVGFGGYATAIPRFDITTGKFSLEEAHNDYLELAASGGLIAVIFVCWFAFVVCRKVLKSYRSRDKIGKTYCFGAALGIAAVAFHSLVDFGLHIPVNIFILFVLIVIAVTDVRENVNDSESVMAKDMSAMLVPAALIVVIIAVGFFAAQIGLSDHYTALASRSSNLDDADRAIGIRPKNCNAYTVRSEILLSENRPDEAANDLETALDLCPQDHRIWLRLGDNREGSGDLAAAETAFRRAVSLAPNYTQPNYSLGQILLREGRTEEAFKYFRIVAQGDRTLYPDIIELAAKTFSNDPQKIENAVGTDTSDAKKAIAVYFIEHSLMTDPIAAFLTENDLNRGEKFVFVEKLIAAKNFDLARKVWLSLSENVSIADQIIFDGGFENLTDADQGAFGWQVDDDQPHVAYAVSEKDAFSGRNALSVRFDGDVELHTRLVSQLVIVKPNTEYELRFTYKSREVVSAGLPQIIVSGAGSNEILGRSEVLKASNEKWTELQVSFTTRNENAVYISLQRNVCDQDPCSIFGYYLFDNFSLDARSE